MTGSHEWRRTEIKWIDSWSEFKIQNPKCLCSLTLFYDSGERIIQAIRNRGYTSKVRLRGLTPR
jgi:hypothetical protein